MDRKVVSYNVIWGSLEEVQLQMNKLIKDGWEPIGNVGSNDRGITWHQAIVKKEKNATGDSLGGYPGFQ